MNLYKKLCALAIGALAASNVQATQISFDFGGIITFNGPNLIRPFDGFNEFPDAIVGESFFGRISLDLPNYLARGEFTNESVFWYGFDKAQMSVTFGNTHLRTAPIVRQFDAGPTQVNVANDVERFDDRTDRLNIASSFLLPSGNPSGAFGGTSYASMSVNFAGGPASSWNSTEIPISSIDTSLFATRRFEIFGGFPNIFVRGDIQFFDVVTTHVSEPGTVALFGFGLFWMSLFGRGKEVRQG